MGSEPNNADFAGSPEEFDAQLQEGQRMLPAVHRAEIAAAHGATSMPPAVFKEVLAGEVAKLQALYGALREMLIPNVDYGLIHKSYWDGHSTWPNGKRKYSRCGRENQPVTLDKDGLPLACSECGAKPSCWKGGAEKVLRFLRLVPSYELDATTLQELKAAGVTGWLPYICRAIRESGEIAGEGRGAASIEKNDADVNKAIKMAKKSALIDCALSFGLSSVFTQDIEKASDYGSDKHPRAHHKPQEAAQEAAGEDLGGADDLGAEDGHGDAYEPPRPSVGGRYDAAQGELVVGAGFIGTLERLQESEDWWLQDDVEIAYDPERKGAHWFKILALKGYTERNPKSGKVYPIICVTTSNAEKHGWGKPGDRLVGDVEGVRVWMKVRKRGVVTPKAIPVTVLSGVRLAAEDAGAPSEAEQHAEELGL